MGEDNPIRIQSMTNTSTLDTKESVRQCIRIIEAGGEYVRLTAQGVREATNLENIRKGLRKAGYQTPLIADIHFNPKAAEAAAAMVEKVRINPGNFADPAKTFQTAEYTDEEYSIEIEKIRERFIPFLKICKEHGTAIRIGVNHGSLSDRIMSRYGDTPYGMVESCMEFLLICVAENFNDVVISIKASNPSVMVGTVRLLVMQMDEENMNFPIHLGVTEAGDGEDGRIKSAVGIGALLQEGIGDTIRVSLSEDPEAEIPVARALVEIIAEKEKFPIIPHKACPFFDPVRPQRRHTTSVGNIGGENVPVVISDRSATGDYSVDKELLPDYLYIGKQKTLPKDIPAIVDYSVYTAKKNTFPLFWTYAKKEWLACDAPVQFLATSFGKLNNGLLNDLRSKPQTVILLYSPDGNIYEQKAFIHTLLNEDMRNPVILWQTYAKADAENFQLRAATDCGAFFIDKLTDGLMLSPHQDACSFGILQASGSRISKTEYISCPSCGRTLFDLQTTIKKVKAATAHLKGLKIAIMGCIVNGPGEMADADYGYVGAGAGKVSLYKGKTCVLKNIPEENAVEELLKIIKSK
ncbi:4-hydroxy-3-methylbut-2-en-1-yl diphosphate synthase (flavodoxin) [Bacteroidia bacterium]|nr:4-hydroxy-3-methylbut-2-en-1-yl diphosphate synthase (flavodoxin) [Bacteroidia bacterium]